MEDEVLRASQSTPASGPSIGLFVYKKLAKFKLRKESNSTLNMRRECFKKSPRIPSKQIREICKMNVRVCQLI